MRNVWNLEESRWVYIQTESESVNPSVMSDSLWPHGLLCPWTSLSMDFFVHGLLQARILEQVAISFSRGSSWPRDQTRVSCIAGRFLPSESPGKSRLFILKFYAHAVRIVWWSFTAEHISVTITQIKKQNITVFLSSHHTPPVTVQAVNNLHYFSSIF